MVSEETSKPTEANTVYLRVKISGTLTCKSDLHVGDGEESSWKERDLPCKREPPDMETDPRYHSVCWSVERKCPYLPASTLRGSLRGWLPPKDPLAEVLFGYVAPPEEGGGVAGKVRFHDAFLEKASAFKPDEPPPFWSTQRHTAARHGIALDPLTGVVAHGRLYSHELIPAGSHFAVELEADKLKASELARLLELLQRWNGGLWSALGARRGKGWGRVCWTPQKENFVRVLTEAGLRQWLEAEDASLDDFFIDLPSPPAGGLQRPPPVEIDYFLKPDGSIVVNEPGYRRRKTKKEDYFPDLEYSRRLNDTAILPGKSLVGAIRARARRIVATIAHQHYEADPGCAVKVADKLIDELFGHTRRRGALWIGDAEAAAEVKAHPQFFNAIDRFTGGVKGQQGEGALYQANAQAGGTYRGKLLLETERLIKDQDGGSRPDSQKDWWKGLLLLLARDVLEGELAVGWGKAKGYGAVRVGFTLLDTEIETWENALNYVRDWGDPAQWLKALHDRIAAGVADCPPPNTATEEEPQA